jgi:hypothetical protein
MSAFFQFNPGMNMRHEPLILSRSITLSSNGQIQQQYSTINNKKLDLYGILRR